MIWSFVLCVVIPIAAILFLPAIKRTQSMKNNFQNLCPDVVSKDGSKETKRTQSIDEYFQNLRSQVVTKGGLNDFGRIYGVKNHGESLDKKLENNGTFYVISPQDMGV